MPINTLLSAFFGVLLFYEALRGFFFKPFSQALNTIFELIDV